MTNSLQGENTPNYTRKEDEQGLAYVEGEPQTSATRTFVLPDANYNLADEVDKAVAAERSRIAKAIEDMPHFKFTKPDWNAALNEVLKLLNE